MYQLAAYIHLLAAIVWLGGMLFLALVLVPLTRGMREPPGLSVRLLRTAARRFRVIGWGALTTLAGTGIWLLLERGVNPLDVVTGRGWFLETHDFVIGPRLARILEVERGRGAVGERALRYRRAVSWLARINLVLALVIPGLSVVLVRGIPF